MSLDDPWYTHDLLGDCWSCQQRVSWEQLKDVDADVRGGRVSLCVECYEALLNMETPG